jgi:hypothetical protein
LTSRVLQSRMGEDWKRNHFYCMWWKNKPFDELDSSLLSL